MDEEDRMKVFMDWLTFLLDNHLPSIVFSLAIPVVLWMQFRGARR